MSRFLHILRIIPTFLILLGDSVRYIIGLAISAILWTATRMRNIHAVRESQKPQTKTIIGKHATSDRFSQNLTDIAIPFRAFFRTTRESLRKAALSIRRFKDILWKKPAIRLRIPTRRRTPPPPAYVSRSLSIARAIRSFFAGVFVTLVLFILPLITLFFLRSLPDPHLLSDRNIDVSTKIFDRNGILLYELFADQNRTPLSLEEIPLFARQATIAIEDKDFYRHNGFSIRGTIRALHQTLINKQLQGGSTITQQLIKSTLLTPEISIERKIKEIFLAFWAERIYSKDQILEMYLNQVPYGGTAWGIESASQTYFGKSARELTLAESSFLAGLPQAPSDYSPYGAHPDKALSRQRDVLRRMVEDDYITLDQAEQALNETIRFKPPQTAIKAPHFVMYVRDILEKRYGSRLVSKGGLRIRTTLDYVLQEQVQRIVASEIAGLTRLRVGNGAVLVTDPVNGDILAMVGSKNYFDTENDGNVNITTSLRQPGSSIKAVTYALALDNGFTPATPLLDTKVTYRSVGSQPYTPVNYDGRYHGTVSLRSALANSYNIPAVRTLAKLGVDRMVMQGEKMGIRSWSDPSIFGLSLTLGSGEVTMLDMARVYGTLASQGTMTELRPILSVTDYKGQIIDEFPIDRTTGAVTPGASFILTDILSDNDARTPAFGPRSSLRIDKARVAVKTGTSNDKRDNWTIGYTPDRVVTVWVGNNDNSPMDPVLTSGITGASTIWNSVMNTLLEGSADYTWKMPDSVIRIPCFGGKDEYFIRGTEPASGHCVAFPTTPPENIPEAPPSTL